MSARRYNRSGQVSACSVVTVPFELDVSWSFGAPSHTSLIVQQFLAEKNTPVITQPPYSPDLAPSDFWLFSMALKGTRFATMEDIKSNATAELRKIPKEVFRRCFQQWQDRWSKCVCVRARVLLCR
jgi:hypothetical protein